MSDTRWHFKIGTIFYLQDNVEESILLIIVIPSHSPFESCYYSPAVLLVASPLQFLPFAPLIYIGLLVDVQFFLLMSERGQLRSS
jgi:hypothetical protein